MALPLASVVACVTANAPDDAVNATVTPGTTLLLEFFTSAVIVAVCEPSDAICGRLVVRVIVS
jgi:hypothetical protein